MALVFGAFLPCRHQKIPWYWYITLAFVDFQGNYLAFTSHGGHELVEKLSLRQMLLLLFLGQVVSFMVALSSFTSSLVASLGVDTPLSLSLFCYLALAVVYGSILLYRRQKLLIPWYWYMALGFVDVQGNYLVNKAFQFSSITSVTLLDCWVAAWIIGLTWYFLGTHYSRWQLLVAALYVVGLSFVLLSDAGIAGGGGSRPLLVDILVIAGTLFYAMSNVGEEFCVKKTHRIEVIFMLGFFGSLVTVCEMYPYRNKKRIVVTKYTMTFVDVREE